ncbi:unnamed protein product [Onchocerca flexuosa]|uniref:Uncharacterized protein n=1 Tax=Onchocerca flexuosa TaxID=387005 RepID=A0A183H0H1_9BILA|nr:unnamed protein product [Onchocerca flexuosa]
MSPTAHPCILNIDQHNLLIPVILACQFLDTCWHLHWFHMLIDVLLTNNRVRMRDPSVVERKLNKIINADKDKLLVRLVT